MATSPLRIGIAGCGSVMRGPYTNQIRRMLSAGMAIEVTAACDTDPARRKIAEDRFGEVLFTTDYRELVTSSDVDLVLVLTSMPQHGPIARAALEAGKHVLVEKPMSVSLSEAAELLELSKQSKGLLVPAPHVVLSPTFQEISRRIHRGEIGQVLQARAIYGWNGPSWGKWFYSPGGGSMFDLGVYNVTSLTALLGPAQRVTAMTGIARPERVVDGEKMKVQAEDTAHILIDFGGDVFAVVTTGFTMQRYRCPAIEIYGSEGTIQMLGDDWDPDGFELWRNDVGAWQIHGETHPDWPWTDGLRHMVECIQNGTRPLITPEHGYHVLEIMLKAQEAGRTGQAQLIESTFTPPSFVEEAERVPVHLIHDPANQ
ncbi:MAG TPA: Gfo/Idh/MocA family oxidoreductase [Roseiflexaceae bacterium]|nr:Gfo/Idh/MocA family oxidoreductase [Roseiflexaceae bacterium]